MQYCSDLRTLISHEMSSLEGIKAQEKSTFDTPDISEYIEFTVYEPVFYKNPGNFLDTKQKIGRWYFVVRWTNTEQMTITVQLRFRKWFKT